MPTFDATAEPNNWPPRWRLNVSLTVVGSATSVTITRRNTDGSTYTVRTASPAALASGAALAYDYESPFRLGGVYTATFDDGRVIVRTVQGLWEFGVDGPWLIHPGIPSLSMPVTVTSGGVGDRTRPARQGAHEVAGRTEPIVNGDGTRGSQRFNLMLRTAWDDGLPEGELQAEDRLRRILEDGSPLLLQVSFPGSRRWRWQWVSVGDTTEADVVPWVDSDLILWTLPCTVVKAPTGSVQAQWTWAGLAARYASWADVAAAYATWANLEIDLVNP